MNRYLLGVVISFLGVLLIFYFWNKEEQHHLTLTAGLPGGIYKPLADSIAAIVKRAYPEIDIEVLESNGLFGDAGNNNQQLFGLAVD